MTFIPSRKWLAVWVFALGYVVGFPALAHACGPFFELRVEKTGPSHVNPGGVVVYTVTATQTSITYPNGNAPTFVFDPIPSGLTFNDASSSPPCMLNFANQNLVMCVGSPMGTQGQTQSWNIAFNVPANPSSCVIENTAYVGSFALRVPTNRSTITTQINCATPTPTSPPPPGSTPTPTPPSTPTPAPEQSAALSIDKVDNRENNSTQRGDTITYKMTVKNTGEADIQDLEINDAIPAGFEIDRGSVTSSVTFVGQNIRWAGVNLAAGKSKSFTVKVKVTDQAAIKGLCNVVTAKSDDHGLSAKDQECVQVKKPPEVKQAIIKAPKAVPVSAKTGGFLNTLIGIAFLSASGVVAWQMKRRGKRIPWKWMGVAGVAIVLIVTLFSMDTSWLKTQVRFAGKGPICSCTCQGADENLLCADPVGGIVSECKTYTAYMLAPGGDASLCAAMEGTMCSFNGIQKGTVVDCNGSP